MTSAAQVTSHVAIGHCLLHSMFDVVPHGSILISPCFDGSLEVAVGLRLSDQALDDGGLGLPANRNGRLQSNNRSLIVALQRHLDSTVAGNLQLLYEQIRGNTCVGSFVINFKDP